jgi:predicted CXXCH cytochrome family protein
LPQRSHYTQPCPPSRARASPKPAANCHSTIFDEYAESVHGAALLGDENPDVPTCIECHGVHDVGDPTTALFRNRSPELCATCHADRGDDVAHYDISTDVFETYVDDFHGTTVTIFQSNDPNVADQQGRMLRLPRRPRHHGGRTIPTQASRRTCWRHANNATPARRPTSANSWTGHHNGRRCSDNPLMFLVMIFYAMVIPGYGRLLPVFPGGHRHLSPGAWPVGG